MQFAMILPVRLAIVTWTSIQTTTDRPRNKVSLNHFHFSLFTLHHTKINTLGWIQGAFVAYKKSTTQVFVHHSSICTLTRHLWCTKSFVVNFLQTTQAYWITNSTQHCKHLTASTYLFEHKDWITDHWAPLCAVFSPLIISKVSRE